MKSHCKWTISIVMFNNQRVPFPLQLGVYPISGPKLVIFWGGCHSGYVLLRWVYGEMMEKGRILRILLDLLPIDSPNGGCLIEKIFHITLW